jgi:transcriptional regulator with XRE-family HTH domain
MPYRLNTELLRLAAEGLGDNSDSAIRERTGISLGSLSRLVNGHVEPSIRHLDALSKAYGVPVPNLYVYIEDATPEGAVA